MSDSTPARKPIPKRLRFEILRRDNHACRYCGATAPDARLTIDHVVPVVLGGSDDPSNLVSACRDCNAGKASSHPDAQTIADVSADALRWARAMAYAAKLDHEAEEEVAEALAWFDESWCKWTYEYGPSNDRRRSHCPRPDDWAITVQRWMDAGLVESDLLHGVNIAMNARKPPHSERWRYFCGVMWNKLTDRQAEARRLIDLDLI